jgi:hypothetical protein
VTHYSANVNSVRVDFFKDTGKWKYTESVHWPSEFWDHAFPGGKINLLSDAFREILARHLGRGATCRMRGLIAVCLHPYHEYEVPLMLRIPEEGL